MLLAQPCNVLFWDQSYHFIFMTYHVLIFPFQRLRSLEMWEELQEKARPSLRHFGREQCAKRIAWAALKEHFRAELIEVVRGM